MQQVDDGAAMPLDLYLEAELARQAAVAAGDARGDTPEIRAARLRAHTGPDAPEVVLDRGTVGGIHRAIHSVDGAR